MAATIGELLNAARDRLDRVPADQPDIALAGLAHIGRGLDLLYRYRGPWPCADEDKPEPVSDLELACRAAAACWPGAGGPVADLLGAAADTLGRSGRLFTPEQRWALAAGLAETARRCVDGSRRFAPYASIPQLTQVRAAAVACERRAALLPTGATDQTALDHLVPGPRGAGGSDAIIDAAAALHLALKRGDAQARPRLYMAEMLITLSAAQLATSLAARIAAHLDSIGDNEVRRAALAAPEAWQAARVACAAFDDGTKRRPPDASAISAAAARLGRSLLAHLGPARPETAPLSQLTELAVPALTAVTSLLPEIAVMLSHGAAAWDVPGRLWAPERRLPSYEDRDAAVTTTHRVVSPTRADLDELHAMLKGAKTLTAALAVQLTLAPEATRLPQLVDAHRAATPHAHTLTVMAGAARDTVRRGRVLQTEEWAFPAPTRTGAPSAALPSQQWQTRQPGRQGPRR